MGSRSGGSSVRIAWRASAIARRKRLSTGRGVSGNRATALRNWRIENTWLTQKMMATMKMTKHVEYERKKAIRASNDVGIQRMKKLLPNR